MAEYVYSAAKAVTLRKKETLQESWKLFSGMFDLHENDANSKSYIYGGYPLKSRVESGGNDSTTGVGDVYKAATVHGTPIIVKITSWNPHHNFSYIEYFGEKNIPTPPSPARTDFRFIEHPEGTMIEIIRREKGDVKFGIRDFLAGRKKPAGWAAARLGHIIEGSFCDTLKNGKSMTAYDHVSASTFVITRDDALRTNFS